MMNPITFLFLFLIGIIIKYPRKRKLRLPEGLIDQPIFPNYNIPKPPIDNSKTKGGLRLEQRFIIDNHEGKILYHYMRIAPITHQDHTYLGRKIFAKISKMEDQNKDRIFDEFVLKSKIGSKKFIQKIRKLKSGYLLVDYYA